MNQNVDKPLLTLNQAIAWQNELRRAKDEQFEIESKISSLENKLAAARVLMEDLTLEDFEKQTSAITVPTTVQDDREPLPDAIKRTIREAGKLLTKIAIRQSLEKEPVHAARFANSPNYFYTAMNRLEKRHKIIRRGKKYGLPSTKNEAPPNGSGSASKVTGEVDASPIESQ